MRREPALERGELFGGPLAVRHEPTSVRKLAVQLRAGRGELGRRRLVRPTLRPTLRGLAV